MTPTPQRSIKSRASLAGHPLHPVMIHFPVAALMALVACDIAYWYTQDTFWLRGGLWLAGVGAFGGWIASVAGIIDLVSVARIRRLITGWSHAIVAVVMLSLASLNWLLRFTEPVRCCVGVGHLAGNGRLDCAGRVARWPTGVRARGGR